MIIILNLSTPKKNLCNKINKLMKMSTYKKYLNKRSTPALAASLAAILKPEQVAAKTIDAQNCNFSSFFSSLVIPLAESYKYRNEIKFFMKYTILKLKHIN